MGCPNAYANDNDLPQRHLTFVNTDHFQGKKWLGRRRAITPAFHFKILEQFVEVFDKNSGIFVDILRKHKPTDGVDIYPLVTLAALDVICGEFEIALRWNRGLTC